MTVRSRLYKWEGQILSTLDVFFDTIEEATLQATAQLVNEVKIYDNDFQLIYHHVPPATPVPVTYA